MVTGRPLDHLHSDVVAIRLVDDDLSREAERFADHVARVIVVVEDALQQGDVEAVVREGQAMNVTDREFGSPGVYRVCTVVDRRAPRP